SPGGRPADGSTSRVESSVRADLGHAVLSVRTIGADLEGQLLGRLAAVRAGGIEVAYVDLSLGDPSASWAADVVAGIGAVFAGVLPLQWGGVDVVRYQHLGATP